MSWIPVGSLVKGCVLVACLSGPSISTPVLSQSLHDDGLAPQEKGLAIATEADRRDLGWHDTESDLRMVLKDRHGQESVRRLRSRALEVEEAGLGDRTLVIFDWPKDTEGTAFLSHTKVVEDDDQWLFLPALRRVKRISSSNKSGPFVGSELAFEDLLSREVQKFEYRWLRDEPCGNLQCFVVESVPLYRGSGYSRQVVWWDREEYRPQRIDYFDRKGELLKRLVFQEYEQYLDRYWRPHVMRMENVQSGKTTDLFFDEWRFQTGQRPADFTPARLAGAAR